jgi:hypothetical protein
VQQSFTSGVAAREQLQAMEGNLPMRHVATSLILLSLWLASPARALAWHHAGHMTIAKIAYQELSAPQKIAIAKVLKAHPHYARYLIDERPAEVSEGEWAFMRAAVWPDWVRPDWPRIFKLNPRPDGEEVARKYNRGTWHYINFPIVVAEDPPVTAPKNLPPPDYDSKGEPGHVLSALQKSMTMLRAADMSDECKAIYLCWLLHLAGDLHQPLHASTLISRQFPYGDQGGNLFLVSVQNGGPAVNLHFFWDALLFGPEASFKDIEAKAEELRRTPELQRDKLPELGSGGFKAWADESFELARKVAYRDGRLQGRRAKGKADLKEIKAPLIPEDYAPAAARVASRRMVLAGYRIADQLALVFRKD